MLRLSEKQLTQALAGLNPTERLELLALLEMQERIDADAPEDPRCPLEDFVKEFGRPPPQSTVRHVVHHDGERPTVEAFIREFALVMPPTPSAPEPKVSSVPDIPIVVPAGRRPRLLADVLERTQEEMRRGTQASDEDRFEHFRGKTWLQSGAYPDE